MATYQEVVLAERPKGDIIPQKTFKLVSKPIPELKDLGDGQVLIRTEYLALDPAMRGWLDDVRSYVPPIPLNGKMRGMTTGTIIASKSPLFTPGEKVYAPTGWTEYCILPSQHVEKIHHLPPGIVARDYLSVLGMTGLTAYFGLLDIGKPKAGELVVVSGAAGATGSVVGQIAKALGCRVVGVAGSEEKCRWLVEELGFDVALNYKDPEIKTKFKEATKSFIDIFFDNTGGPILDLSLSRAKPFSRFIICGGISQYNSPNASKAGPKNYLNIVSMRITMRGFIVMDYQHRFEEARRELEKWVLEGKVKRKETVLKGGLEVADTALVGLYKGVNTGKLLVEIKPPTTAGEAKL